MKTNIILLILLSNLFLMCKNDVKKDEKIKTGTEEIQIKTSKKEPTVKVTESANYDSLFKLNSNICLTTNEISKATGISISAIQQDDKNTPSHCFYNIKLPNGETMNYHYYVSKWNKKDIQKEIKSYLKSKKNGENRIMKTDIELSSTGDCYLTQQINSGRLMIVNSNYNNIVISTWDKMAIRLKNDQKKIRIEYAKKIANYLVKKHKK